MGVSAASPFLLDTHVLLWLIGEPVRVPTRVRERLADPENALLVSAVSALEIATKTRIGKLPDIGLITAWSRRIAEIGGSELPVTSAHALTAGSMPWEHRDPFDRLLAAQAIHERAVLVTVDRAFDAATAVPLLRW